MAMSQAELSAQLIAVISGVSSEADAIDNLVGAYAAYAADATALTPLLSTTLGETAMATALIGMSAPGAGIAKWVSGFQQFWVGIAGGLTTSFAGAIAISPPPFTGLAVALPIVFAANQSNEESFEDAMDAIATAVHSEVAGGTVTTAGPTITVII